MDHYSILDHNFSQTWTETISSQEVNPQQLERVESDQRETHGKKVEKQDAEPSRQDHPAHTGMYSPPDEGDGSVSGMAQRDLNATLQLLAERAQYITGATGAAIALREGAVMLCRASSGSSAPELGAHLQVDSGLSGESVRTGQILRCDDADTDARVNRESCRALGIASVLVMPLLRENEITGVFELFSEKAYAFAQRDIAALERLGEMVHTALDHAEAARAKPGQAEEQGAASVAEQAEEIRAHARAERSSELEILVSEAKPHADKDAGRAALKRCSTQNSDSPQVAERVAEKIGVANSGANQGPEKPMESELGPLRVDGPAHGAFPPVLEAAGQDQTFGLRLCSTQGRNSVATKTRVESEELPELLVPSQQDRSVAALPDSEVSRAQKFETSGISVGQAEASDNEVKSELAGIRKCGECGFPVSEGRTLCLDCESKFPNDEFAIDDEDMEDGETPDFLSRFMGGMGATGSGETWVVGHKYLIGTLAVVLLLIMLLVLSHPS